MNRSRSHDEAVVEMLRADPELASVYLQTALAELHEAGGHGGFLTALRHIVEARGGFGAIAEKAGLSRESRYRALSPKGNPTLRTMASVVQAAGLRLAGGP